MPATPDRADTALPPPTTPPPPTPTTPAMTTPAARATPTAGATRAARRFRSLLSVVPWVVVAAAWVVGLERTGTALVDVGVYAVYYVAAIIVPGTLVHRALRGSRGNVPEDVALGAATGLVVLLVGWALCAVTGLQALLPGWPLLVLVPFAAVPRLRAHWRIPVELREPLPALWSWIMAGAVGVLVVVNYKWQASTPLPPATTAYFQDFLYHLALVREMTRSMPFQVPQMAGETLRYHYLSDADMAVAGMITRIPAAVILLRLWIVPIAGLAALVTAVVGRRVTGRWWAGALAGAATAVAAPLMLGEPVGAVGQGALSALSPSAVFSIPLLGLLVTVAVDALDGRTVGRAWFLIFPLALVCAGAKSSALPPFVAGFAPAGIVVAWRHRERLRVVAGFFALVLAAMLAGARAFAGGGAGTLAVQPFAILEWSVPYRLTLGTHDTIDGTLSLPLGVQRASVGGGFFVAGLLCLWVILQAPRTAGLLALRRFDPAAWLLGGMTLAGSGGLWLLWHPSASQVYFFTGVIPFATVATVGVLADRFRSWRSLVAGLVAGGSWAVVAPVTSRPGRNTLASWTYALVTPLLWTALAVAVVGGLALAVWRWRSGRYAWGALSAGLIAAVLGAGFVTGVRPLVQEAMKSPAAAPARQNATGTSPTTQTNGSRTNGSATTPASGSTSAPPSGNATPPAQKSPAAPVLGAVVGADEMRAAMWVDRHAGRDDLVATNVHCRIVTAAGACDARAFWVSALTGRRALIESWGYTDRAVAADGVDGLRYYFQPAPDQQLFALNQRVFSAPTAADLATLRDRYRVRWLFADSGEPGGVSPELSGLAREDYRLGKVTVYRL